MKDGAAIRPRKKRVVIAYGSIYGNTENAAEILLLACGKEESRQ